VADQISFQWDAHAFNDMTDTIGPATRKATMYALRSTGRFLARTAKAKAPVYNGTDPRAQAERGNLRKSIKNARHMDAAGEVFALKVAPWGSKKQGTAVTRTKREGAGVELRGVPLYRNQMEEIYGFMSGAIMAADTEAKKVFEEAFAKAWEKYRA
jgi:hypothetical protein